MNLKLYASMISIGIILLLILGPINISFFPYSDKVSHFLVSGFVFLIFSSFLSIRKSVLFSILLLSGAEFLQMYIPSRDAEVGDFLANIGGVLGFWFLYSNTWLTSKLKAIKLLPS